MRKRYDDIIALLIDAGQNIMVIELTIRQARYDLSVREILKPKIKSTLEHFRSCLDYCALDIFEQLISNECVDDKKIYFPYGKNEEIFRKQVKKNLTDTLISSYPDVYLLIESIQSYKLGNAWLEDLCCRTNNMKHNSLSSQERADGIAIQADDFAYIKADNTSTVILDHVKLEDNFVNSFTYDKGHTLSDYDFTLTEIKIDNWTEFRFEGTNICVLDFVKKVHRSISDFITQLYRLLSINSSSK